MELTEQANTALDAMLDRLPVAVNAEGRSLARMMWLDGYKCGMEAVGALAQASFERLQAELS